MIDENTALETAKEGAKAFTKLGEIVNNIFSPKWIRSKADADKYSDERKLEVIRQNPDMDIAYINGVMSAKKKTPDELLERANQRIYAKSINEERNIERIIEVAAEHLESSNNISDEDVEGDWVTRFFDIAKDISNEQMQYIWGKILAGEVSKPGSFSLRTLDTIRNLSKSEAQLFQKIMPCILRTGGLAFLPSNESLLRKYGVKYIDLVLLDECGLLNIANSLSSRPTLSSGEEKDYLNCKSLIRLINKEDSSIILNLGLYKLTAIGMELFSILKTEPSTDYMVDFVNTVFSDNRKVKLEVTFHEIESLELNHVRYVVEPYKVINSYENK